MAEMRGYAPVVLWGGGRSRAHRVHGPRPLFAPRRIYLGDRLGEPRPHGQNRRPPRSEYSISNRPNKLLGTHPLNWFPLRNRSCSFAGLPNPGGIAPLNWLKLRLSDSRLAGLPNPGGIAPLSWLLERDSLVTRPLTSVVTPPHSLIGTSLSQLLFLSQFGPPVAL